MVGPTRTVGKSGNGWKPGARSRRTLTIITAWTSSVKAKMATIGEFKKFAWEICSQMGPVAGPNLGRYQPKGKKCVITVFLLPLGTVWGLYLQ